MLDPYSSIRCPVCAIPWDAENYWEEHPRDSPCYRYRNCEIVRMARLEGDRRAIEVNMKEEPKGTTNGRVLQ